MLLRYLFASFWFLFGLIWAVVGSVVFAIGVFLAHEEYVLSTRGERAQAVVTDKSISRGSKNKKTYKVAYTFNTPDGLEHSAHHDISSSVWNRTKVGQSIPVVYQSGRPEKNRPAQQASSDRAGLVIFLVLGTGFGGFGWYLLIRSIVTNVRRYAVIRKGQLIVGQVTSIETDFSTKINNRHPRYFTFSFIGLDGNGYAGQSMHLPRKLEEKFKVGDSINIVVDPQNPQSFEPDIFGVRTAGPNVTVK